MHDNIITADDLLKIFGVTSDSSLSWRAHCNETVRKCNGLKKGTQLTLIKSMIFPYFDYYCIDALSFIYQISALKRSKILVILVPRTSGMSYLRTSVNCLNRGPVSKLNCINTHPDQFSVSYDSFVNLPSYTSHVAFLSVLLFLFLRYLCMHITFYVFAISY